MNKDHSTKPEIDNHTGVETTGHEWDGIKELNNPLPRWWLWIFYACCVWSVVYWIFMPSWPGINSHLRGTRNHSDRANVAAALETLKDVRKVNAQRLLAVGSVAEIEQDPELLQFAITAGHSAFGDNCATCHGTGGGGFKGYPNLNDDVWLWGGSLAQIKQTITYGIRNGHDQARTSQMPAFGDQNILNRDQINDMTSYVEYLAGQKTVAPEIIARVVPVYQAQCVSCHGAAGTGDRTQGAPNLTDAEWLYGGSREEIRAQIIHGRNGVMPVWGERLDEATITALAVYVHTLGGGE
ncbi:MAG: cytochrome-c oxidase, cbb3-type subunit III [Parvularculaceae bacterium]